MNKLVLRDSDIFVPRRSLVSDPGVMPESPYIGVDALSRAQRRWSRYWLQPRTTLVPYTIGLHGLGLGGGGCCGAVPGTPFPALSGCCASCDRGGPCTGTSGCSGCDCGGVGEVTMETARPYVLPVLVGAALGYLARGSLLGTAVGGALGAGAYWAYNRVETGIASAVATIARGRASAPTGESPALARLAAARARNPPGAPVPIQGLSSFLNDLDPRPASGEDAPTAHSRASLRYVQLGVALSAIALIFEVTTRRRARAARVTNRRRGRKARMRNGKQRTYKQAQADIMDRLQADGWTVVRGLKVPHATSPQGRFRVWFKAQAVYLSDMMNTGRHTLGDARSMWLGDIRNEPTAMSVARIRGWMK